MMYGNYGSFGMGGFLIGFLIMAVLLALPFYKILPRIGIPAWVAVFAIVPMGALVLLWIVAFKDDLTPAGEGK